MERAARARLRTGTQHQSHTFHVIPGSVHEHKRDLLNRKKKEKEFTVKYVIIAVFVAAAVAIAYLAVQFGS